MAPIMVEQIDWRGALTLEEYVVRLFQENKTNSREFHILEAMYGKEKIAAIWEKHQGEANNSENWQGC